MVKGLLKFFWEDIKETSNTLWAMLRGKAKLRYSEKKLFKIDWVDMLKTYWPLFIVVILAFFCGYYVAAKALESKCQNIVVDLIQTQGHRFGIIKNISFNISDFIK